MNRFLTGALSAVLAILTANSNCSAQEVAAVKAKAHQTVVIPMHSPIDKPALFILRRGLKDAISNHVDTIVIDMKTPGGRLDVTLDIMEALDRFPGKKITYVNDEATSAGAIIASVTDDIYFAPRATMGAAEVVSGSGADVGESMKRKINSYMNSKIRAYTEQTPLRAEVIRSMMDPEYEFKIGDKVIKEKGELLSLTAIEATELYGEPPRPLLAAGIAGDIDDLLSQVHGKGNYSVVRLETSWSENLAQYLTAITPILLALGLLGLFIEFKTPGFGIFGISGLVLLVVVFFGHHVAGLSGYEPVLILFLGLLLIALELFVFPGTFIPALIGAILVLGALVWAMLDVWPGEPVSISGDALLRPLLNVTLGVVGAVALCFAILKFLPRGGPWGQMILNAAVAGEPNRIRPILSDGSNAPQDSELVGQSGTAVTALFPSGQVEISGKRYEAKLDVGFAEAGTPVTVTDISEFGLNVEVKS